MAAWRETMSRVSAHAPKLPFGDRSKIAKEIWELQKAKNYWDKVDRAYRWALVAVAVVLATALGLQLLIPSKPPLSQGIRLREIQGLVRAL